jgi:hypothetical protein
MRRMARFTTELLVPDDEGRKLELLLAHRRAPRTCRRNVSKGRSEVQLYRFGASGTGGRSSARRR